MNEEIESCSRQLMRLGKEYYHMQLSQEEYREQRRQLLDRLEAEMRKRAESSEARATAPDTSETSL